MELGQYYIIQLVIAQPFHENANISIRKINEMSKEEQILYFYIFNHDLWHTKYRRDNLPFNW